MANPENVRSKGFQSRSPEELKEISRKGGINSGAARRKRKGMKESAKVLMELDPPKALKQKMKVFGIDEDDASYPMAVAVALLQNALEGDERATRLLLELIGEDPRQALQKKDMELRREEFEHKKEMDLRGEKQMEDVYTQLDEVLKQIGGVC